MQFHGLFVFTGGCEQELSSCRTAAGESEKMSDSLFLNPDFFFFS